MSRGDQRERDRLKKQKKLQAGQKNQTGGSVETRNMNDKAALEAKNARKSAMKKAEEEAALKAPQKRVVKKKVTKKADPGLDDLLSAGLNKTKK